MKVAILTLCNGANYGGTLQCYALSQVIKSMGHEATVLAYTPSAVAPIWKKFAWNVSCCRNFTDFKRLYARVRNPSVVQVPRVDSRLIDIFDSFRNKYLSMTKSLDDSDISDAIQDFDAIIIGSDQVWGAYLLNDLRYFGNFKRKTGSRLISYSACTPNLSYPLLRKRRLASLINSFDFISVRDSTTATMVRQLIGKESPIVVDPTMLYDFEVETTASLNHHPPYILTYVLGDDFPVGNELLLEKVKARIRPNAKIIGVDIYGRDIDFADKTVKDADPIQWVDLIRNASVVVTDSFHAMVFAIKFRRPFISYYSEPNRASRLLHLSELVNMRRSLVYDEETLRLALEQLDTQYDSYMEPSLDLSYGFLHKALSK